MRPSHLRSRSGISAIPVVLGLFGACGGGDRAGIDDQNGFHDSAPDGGAACEGKLTCSRDLRAVVDACDESRVAVSCKEEEACGEGRCVPACSPEATRNSSLGCEFAALLPARAGSSGGSCFAAFIANTWVTPTTIEAEYEGASLDLAASARIVRTDGENVTYEPFRGAIGPGETAILFLAQSPHPTSADFWIPCPNDIPPAVHALIGISGTGRGSSFRIKTSAPVSAYSIYPFGGAASHFPSATLLLPVPAWKAGYIMVDAWEVMVTTEKRFPTIQVVAAEDETDVTISASTNIQPGAGVEGAAQNVPQSYHLQRGQVLQFAQYEELTGSRLTANRSVAVFGGHECMFIPSAHMACDVAQLQLFPVQTWGHEYVAAPYRSRRPEELPETYFFRVVAAADGTNLTYEPARPEGAPETLESGRAALFTTRDPFVVKSQDAAHPVALYSYMSGADYEQALRGDGDPEFTGVVPAEQYLRRYVFFVDPTYPNSQLVVVRSRSPASDFKSVVLDCAGPLDGWEPIGTEGKYEYVRVYLTKQFALQTIGTGRCGAGRHEIESEGAFGVTVWGTGNTASYAYPGGAALRTVNTFNPSVR